MNVKLTIPTEQKDISLRQFQEFAKLGEDHDENFLQQKMIEIFCNVRLNQVLFIDHREVKRLSGDISELLNLKPEPQYRFKIKGQEFGMIPNLEAMSFGEYVDLDTYIGDWETMHKAMAVLFRPIDVKHKDKYTIHPYTGSDDFAELMQFMPLDIVMGAMVFFYRLGNELLKATQNYLGEELKEMVLTTDNNLPKSMDGIIQSIHSQREILINLIESQSTGLDNVLHY